MEDLPQLVNVLRASRTVFEQEHAHLPAAEIERLWQRQWLAVESQVNTPSRLRQQASTVPQKRSSPTAHVTMEPPSKRAGLVVVPDLCLSSPD